MLAAGAYSGDAGIFDERTGELLYVLQGQKGGITQVRPCRRRKAVFKLIDAPSTIR